MKPPLTLCLLVLLGLSGCRAVRVPDEAARASYQIRDLTPTFWRFWDEAALLTEAEQLQLLEAKVVRAHPEVYTARVLGLDMDKPLSAELADRWPKFLKFAGATLPLARTLSDSIGRDLPSYDASFRKAFPDFAYTGEVYFVVSLGGFDGGLREVKGRMALLFGVDIIAAVNGADANPKAFFDHELFHVYHQQFPDPELDGTLARSLWAEGLAQYVAGELNPGTSEAALLGLPHSSPGRVRANLAAIARDFRQRLDSRASDDYARYFLGSAEDREPPSRAGYTLGYLVAKQIAGGRTLQDLAKLRGPALRAEIDRALVQLAGP